MSYKNGCKVRVLQICGSLYNWHQKINFTKQKWKYSKKVFTIGLWICLLWDFCAWAWDREFAPQREPWVCAKNHESHGKTAWRESFDVTFNHGSLKEILVFEMDTTANHWDAHKENLQTWHSVAINTVFLNFCKITPQYYYFTFINYVKALVKIVLSILQ